MTTQVSFPSTAYARPNSCSQIWSAPLQYTLAEAELQTSSYSPTHLPKYNIMLRHSRFSKYKKVPSLWKDHRKEEEIKSKDEVSLSSLRQLGGIANRLLLGSTPTPTPTPAKKNLLLFKCSLFMFLSFIIQMCFHMSFLGMKSVLVFFSFPC